jgi:hypothetical protein
MKIRTLIAAGVAALTLSTALSSALACPDDKKPKPPSSCPDDKKPKPPSEA